MALVTEFHVSFKVPLVKVVPEANQIWKNKLVLESLSNVPVVSVGKVSSTFDQDEVTEKLLETCLVLSAS